jgi:hypothetical protein
MPALRPGRGKGYRQKTAPAKALRDDRLPVGDQPSGNPLKEGSGFPGDADRVAPEKRG